MHWLANYEHFHRPGITDEAKMKEESEWRYDHGGWTSVMHYHSHLADCTDECKIYGTAHEHSSDCEVNCSLKTKWEPLSLHTQAKQSS